MAATRYASSTKPRRSLDTVSEPLDASHQFFLADAIAAAAPDWSVELYSDSPGTATIIILPDDADDEVGPTYFVHRDGDVLCLDQLHWDSYSSVGRFTDLDSVARVLRSKLLCAASMAMPASRTLH